MKKQNFYQKHTQLPLWGKITTGILIFIILGVWLRFQKNYANFELERYARYDISEIFDKQEEYFKRFTHLSETQATIEFAQSISELGDVYYSKSKQYYDYEMTRESPNTVIVTAKAKKSGLKSFTGSLFIKSGYITRRLCETKELSQVPPPIIQTTDIENGCPSNAELYNEGSFSQQNKVTYEVNFIGDAGCEEYNAFHLPSGHSRIGHFEEFVDKYGVLDNKEFFLQVKNLRAKRDYCNQNTAMMVCNLEGECAKAGFNMSLKSSKDSNNTIDIAVVSYMPPLNGGARPIGSPDLYVFDPTNQGMEWRTSTTVGKNLLDHLSEDKLKELWSIFMR